MLVPDDCPLQPREFEIVVTLARGGSHDDVADELGIRNSTVRNHVHTACQKLECNTRAELVAILYQRGWIRVPGTFGESDAMAVSEAQDGQKQAEGELAEVVLELASERKEAQVQREQNELTPAQVLYVQAFMVWLRSQTEDDLFRRVFMLTVMYSERSMLSGQETFAPWEVLGPPKPNRRPPKLFRVRITPRTERREHDRRVTDTPDSLRETTDL